MTEELDIGGALGFGPVPVQRNAALFHEPWERKIFGMVIAGLELGIDDGAAYPERLHPVVYLRSTYYERWILLLEAVLSSKGLLSQDEIDARVRELAEDPSQDLPARRDPQQLAFLKDRLKMGFERDIPKDHTRTPRFVSGDRVEAAQQQPPPGIRLPGYVRGRRGIVAEVWPAQVFPGTSDNPSWENLYSVVFPPTNLWSSRFDPRSTVVVDIWERYLSEAN